MTQEDKNLLLKDLCARLPYGVKIDNMGEPSMLASINHKYRIIVEITEADKKLSCNSPKLDVLEIEDARPYLFPLSSMTKEQYKEWCDLEEEPLDDILTRNAKGVKMSTLEHHLLIAKSLTDSINYCYENHFDIYGLIPMGLAIDATGKNIY